MAANIYRPPSYLYNFLLLEHFGVLGKTVLEKYVTHSCRKSVFKHTEKKKKQLPVYEFHVKTTKGYVWEGLFENPKIWNNILNIKSGLSAV